MFTFHKNFYMVDNYIKSLKSVKALFQEVQEVFLPLMIEIKTYCERTNSTKSPISSPVRLDVTPCLSSGLYFVSTSSIVAARPSYRYGAVRQISTRPGVSNSLSLSKSC